MVMRCTYMSAGGGSCEDGVTQARDEDTGQLLLFQQGALCRCQQNLRSAQQDQIISAVVNEIFVPKAAWLGGITAATAMDLRWPKGHVVQGDAEGT